MKKITEKKMEEGNEEMKWSLNNLVREVITRISSLFALKINQN